MICRSPRPSAWAAVATSPLGRAAASRTRRALLDEAHRILRTRARSVERELTATERDQVGASLASLERTMTSDHFNQDDFDAAHARADRAIGEHLGRWRKGEMREYAESIGIAVAVALMLRAFVVEAFKIPSGSMIPTLDDRRPHSSSTSSPTARSSPGPTRAPLPAPPSEAAATSWSSSSRRTKSKTSSSGSSPSPATRSKRWTVGPSSTAGSFRTATSARSNTKRTPRTLYVEYILEDRSFLTLFENKPDEQTCVHRQQRLISAGLGRRGGVCGMSSKGRINVAPNEAWVMGDNRNNSHDSRGWRGGMGAGVPFENIKGRAMFVWMSFGAGGGIAQDRLFVNVMGHPVLPGSAGTGPRGASRKMHARASSRRSDDSTPPSP